MQDRRKDESFWHPFLKDFPTAADYFSPAIVPLQDYLGVGSKEILYSIGDVMGRKVAEKFKGRELNDVLSELSRIWESKEIGRFEVVGLDPLTLLISDCRICGQLSGTGGMFECSFHEGFFQSVLSNCLGKKVNLRQETNFEGEAGTWCRRFVTDIKM